MVPVILNRKITSFPISILLPRQLTVTLRTSLCESYFFYKDSQPEVSFQHQTNPSGASPPNSPRMGDRSLVQAMAIKLKRRLLQPRRHLTWVSLINKSTIQAQATSIVLKGRGRFSVTA
ncbi:hypothetical protein BDDG_07071 [Blastomyces dermatitidis ATCC 18188]|uniref:Uncharacterized protein n=1 Tax=Ajellomyces dermatitidis (strain ATCC 18188 / CBS 674.68) TaxID=653446 RepID=F2TLL3_AJEDA|nr:hypothetical protein BDDG_07071 [Blastomyces dermatitidis ATCC 18188]